jgi:Na+-translocating ferredoxin:NAD+ oxidoreductase RnfE subunit
MWGPVFISERDTTIVSVFSDPFASSAWKIIGLIIGLAVLTTVIIDRHGSRSRHIPASLSVFNSVDPT